MELRHVRVFLAVLDAGSLGDAGRLLGHSQSAVSKSIRALELSIGGQLFHRSVVGSAPTALALALEPHARALLNQAERALNEMADLLGARRGRITIIAGPLFADALFSVVHERFRQQHPDVDVAFKVGYYDVYSSALRSGDAELAFCMLERRDYPDLTADVMMSDQRIVIVAAPSHPLVGRRSVTAKELLEHHWVLPDKMDLFRGKLTEVFARYGLPGPEPTSEFNELYMQRMIVKQGTHIGILSELVVREDIRTGALCVIKAPDIGWRFSAGALYRKDAVLSPAARRFLDIARAVSHEMAVRRRH